MTGKHRSSEYKRNARLRRAQVTAAHRLGDAVVCWRGGKLILPGQHYDIGHVHRHGGEGLDNLAPEHRHRVEGCCKGNRSDGGTIGANITNRRHPTPETASTWKL
mgnify:CR=1 FL=1